LRDARNRTDAPAKRKAALAARPSLAGMTPALVR